MRIAKSKLNRSITVASLIIGVGAAASLVLATDCGHPPKMHTCTDGQTRIRMDIQEDVPVSEITSSSSLGVPALVSTVTDDNPTCTWSTVSRTWSTTYTNGYKVGAALQNGASAEVTVGTPKWTPIAAQAKIQASSSVTITGELQRDESHTDGDSVSIRNRCALHTVKVFRTIKNGVAQQTFADRVTCNIQDQSNPLTTECNVRVINAKSDGTREIYYQHSETPYNCDCPPDQGDS